MKTMICVDNLAYSYANYEVFSSINEITSKSPEEISIVPLDITSSFMKINTAVHNVAELGSFKNGILIATTILNAQKILGCASNARKVLYLYDLDWMFRIISFDVLYSILNDPSLTVILRSESFIRPLSAICGDRKYSILPEFNLEKLWNSL